MLSDAYIRSILDTVHRVNENPREMAQFRS